MQSLIGLKIDQQTAQNIVFRLYEEEAITKREAKIMSSILERELYKSTIEHRDEVRANLLKAMIETLKYTENH